MSIPEYDILRGHPNKDATWVEALDTLAAANHRMVEHARQNAGPYFIVCHISRAVQSGSDTSKTKAATTEQGTLQRTNHIYSIMLMKKKWNGASIR
jgi:hypothetical protein